MRTTTGSSHADALLNLLTAMEPDGLDRQQAQGQAELCATTELPKKIQDVSRATLEALGFKFGEATDPLFVRAELPEGWALKPTDHPMWTNLVDNRARVRGSIFYKAAFYDRDAFMRMTCRFHVSVHEDGGNANTRRVSVKDAIAGEALEVGEYAERDWDACDELGKKAKAWLAEHYPDWRNPLAYWGD